MARKSKNPQTDEGMFVPYTDSDQLVPPIWADEEPFATSAARDLSIYNLRRMHHRVHASPLDPLSVAWLIDSLQRWSPAYYVRSRYIVNRLNAAQTALNWETTQTGRMMGEITELANEEYAEYPALIPLHMKMDYRGNAWFINSQPGTYRWFWKIRTQLMELAKGDIELENIAGTDRPVRASVYEAIDTTAEVE